MGSHFYDNLAYVHNQAFIWIRPGYEPRLATPDYNIGLGSFAASYNYYFIIRLLTKQISVTYHLIIVTLDACSGEFCC